MKTHRAACALVLLVILAVAAAGAQEAGGESASPRSIKGGVRSITDPEPPPAAEKPAADQPKTPWEGQLAVPGWVEQNRRDSVHFSLMAQAADDAYGQRLIADLERNFSELQKEFWDFIPPRWREAHIDVVMFSTQEAFDDYAVRDGGLPRGKKGYSSPKEPRIVLLRQDVYYRDVMIAVHEMTHVFNRFCTSHTPIWLDEGMAQYYSDYAGEAAGNASLKSGVNVEALSAIESAVRSGGLVPFSLLMQMPDEAFYGEGADLHYAEAWALVYWMRRAWPDGDAMFTSLYAAVARGRDGFIAFSESYGYNHPLIADSWLDYLARLYNERTAVPPAEGDAK